MVVDGFIITRKRRRNATAVRVDPGPSKTTETGGQDQAAIPADYSSSIHDFSSAVPSSPRRKSDPEDQVTVEDFLQWSVAASLRSRKARKRRIVKFGEVSDDKPVSDSDGDDRTGSHVRKRRRSFPRVPASDDEYQPSEEDRHSPSTSRKQSTSHSRPKSLAGRMLRAAVLSHVDIDCKDLPAESAIRKPLKFATKAAITPPSNYLNADKIRLVDPRRVSFHSSAFRRPVTLGKESHTQDATRTQGFTQWAHPKIHTTVSGTPPRPKLTKNAHIPTLLHEDMPRTRPPLSFIAPRSPNVVRSSPSKCHRGKDRTCSPQGSGASPVPLGLVPLSNRKIPHIPRHYSPTSSLIIISSSEDEDETSPLQGLSSPLPDDAVLGSSARQQLVFLEGDIAPDVSPPEHNHDTSQIAKSQLQTSSHSASRPAPSSRDNCEQLRPLVSFMDDFTETARKVAQSEGKKAKTTDTLHMRRRDT